MPVVVVASKSVSNCWAFSLVVDIAIVNVILHDVDTVIGLEAFELESWGAVGKD